MVQGEGKKNYVKVYEHKYKLHTKQYFSLYFEFQYQDQRVLSIS